MISPDNTVQVKNCNLEREYRDCIKSRRDKIGITRHIMMHQVLYNVHCHPLHWPLFELRLLVSCPFLMLLVFSLDIEHLNTYHYNIPEVKD